MRKKVMFIITSDGMGGLQNVNAQVSNDLTGTYDVALFRAWNNKENLYHTEAINIYNKRFNAIGIRAFNTVRGHLKISLPSKLLQKWISWTAKLLYKKIDTYHPEVLILSSDLILQIPYLKKHFPQMKFIAWCHNNYETYLKYYYQFVKPSFVEGLAKADKVVCLTESDRKGFGVYNSETVVIGNPLTFQNSIETSNLEKKVISWVGRFQQPMKGLDFLVYIAQNIPSDWRISIAGGGTSRQKKWFEQLLAKYDVLEKCDFCGQLAGTELEQHYINSSIYLSTSRWEGWGLTLTEAMSFGLPVVSFEQSGSSEILCNGKYGFLIKNENIEKMVEEILNLIKNKDLRLAYSKLSLKRVKDFSSTIICKQWEKVISE